MTLAVPLEISSFVESGTEPVTKKAAHLFFRASLGSTDEAFADALVSQLISSTSGREMANPKTFGFAMAVVQGIEPRNELEAMLAAQMAMVHIATMWFARSLSHVDTLPQQDSAVGALTRLTRTFATQMEALKRYRGTGEQKVTVQHQHVTVNDNARALVGNVTPGGVRRKSERQPHEPIACPPLSGRPTMHREGKSHRREMPGPRGQGLARVPCSWRSRRSAVRKRNPRYRHGNRTREAIEMRRELQELLRAAHDLCGSI